MADKKGMLEEERRKGGLAAGLLEHPLWAETWDEHRKQVLAAWEKCPDAAARDAMWTELQIATNLRRRIERYVQTGQMAVEQLRREETKQ